MARAFAASGFAASLLLGCSANAFAAGTFYVDPASPQASDTGPGTQAQPYRTLGAAVTARGGAGTTILVAGGTYREEVTFKASGTSTSPFIVRSITPGGAVIDGAESFATVAQWVLASGNVWRASSVNWSPKQVLVNGVRLTASSAATTSLPANTFRYVSGQGLFVNAGGGNPGLRATFVGKRTYGFRLSGRSWITIEGFAVTRSEERGFYLSSSSNQCVIRGNTITFAFRNGIYSSSCTGARFTGNIVTDCIENGIGLSSSGGAIVDQNESARSGLAGGAAASGIQCSGSTSVRLERNRLHHNTGSGIEIVSSSSGCVMVQNRSWLNTRDGFRVSSSTGARLVCNVASGNSRRGFSHESSSGNGSLSNSIAVNNGIGTNEYDLYVDSGASSGFVSNDNVIWNATAQAPVRFISTVYTSLTTFASATGRDTRSFQLDPRFVAPASGGFQLAAGSPAIDAANTSVLEWPSTDAEGQARFDEPGMPNVGLGPVSYADRGALERVVFDPAPIAALTLTPSSGRAPLAIVADASASTDPDDGIASYAFDFGDGVSTGAQTTATAPHTFAEGSWTVQVVVTDVGGHSSSISRSIVVTPPNRPPHAALSATALANGGFRTMITDASAVFTPPALPRPGYLTPGDDPTFGTTVTRIAGNAGTAITGIPGGTWSIDARHHYSKDQPWNADGTLIWLENSGTPNRVMLDGETYQPVGGPCPNYDLGDDRWHVSMPHVRVGAKNSELAWFDVITCTKIRSWPLPFPIDYFGPSEGNTSHDGRFAALTDGQRAFVVDMDPQPPFAPYPAQRIGPAVNFTGCGLPSCAPGWVSISPSGKYVVVKYTDDHPRVYDVNPATLELTPRPMPVGSPRCAGTAAQGFVYDVGHADMALDPDDGGEDILVGQEHCGWSGTIVNGQLMGKVTKVRLRDGAVTSLTDPTNEAASHHVSMRNLARPGWAYVGYRSDPGKRFSDEVIAVRTDGSKQVQRFGHKHSLIGAYRTESHPVPSPDGRRVMFVSNWAINCTTCGTSSDVKSYVFDARDLTAGSGSDLRTYRFDAGGSSDPDGPLATYQFSFGDGLGTGPQTWATTNHTFAYGSYAVKVTVTDPDGAQDSAFVSIDVVPPNQAPDGIINQPAADTSTVILGNSLEFTSTVLDPNGNTPLGIQWSFGGGAADRTDEDPGFVRFDALGVFPITLTVTDALGLADPTPDRVTVRVVEPPPDRAPVLSLPDTLFVLADSSISVTVGAIDPDGDPVQSLTADLQALPGGHDAQFNVVPDHTSGTFTWRPRPEDVRPAAWTVEFRASNALAASATLVVFVTRPPQVTAPDTIVGQEGTPITVSVTAFDPDGDAIQTLAAGTSDLPSGALPSFSAAAGNGSGVLTWTPDYGNARALPYRVVFTAANAFSATGITQIVVRAADRPPQVTAPASFVVTPDSLVSFAISAADLDGEPIDSVSVDVSGLPAANTASFTASGAGGSFAWRPLASDVRSTPWSVVFTAWNARSGSTTTTITVTRPPTITAPDTVHIAEGQPLTLNVAATDPDGDVVTGLAADLAGLPQGHTASFALANGYTGTLSWTPGYADGRAAPYPVTFTAHNALGATRTTWIVVDEANRPPIVTAPATASVTEGQLLTFHITAGDPDADPIANLAADLSALPAGHTASFTADRDFVGGTLSWTPGSAHGGAPPYRVIFTATNGLTGSDTTWITVADVPDFQNLCGNPSFETNTTGWSVNGSSTLTRIAGGQDGDWSLKVQGPATTAEFGVNDSPNWLATITAGVRYRYTAWVKASTGAGRARIKLREYRSGTQVGSTLYSPTLIMNAAWQQLAVEFVAQGTGNNLDMQVLDLPTITGEICLVDNIAIVALPPSGAAPAPGAARSVGEDVPASDAGSPRPNVPLAKTLRVTPQPASDQSTIEFTLSRPSAVDVRLYDANGREVRSLMHRHAEAGGVSLSVGRRGPAGERLSPGVYFLRIRSDSGNAIARVVFVD